MKLKKGLFLLAFAIPVVGFPLTSCYESNFSDIPLGTAIENNMKQSRVFSNNFAFFGGDDVSYTNYDLYSNQGYKDQVELFEDYIKLTSPYTLSYTTSASDTIASRYTYGRRVVFDVTSPGSTIKDALDKFDTVTTNYNILTTIYNVDTKDVNSLSVSDFKQYLKTFIDKSLALQNDTGMVVIKNHYTTNDNTFNSKNEAISKAIEEVVATNYWSDSKKYSRISVVDHTTMSSNKTLISPDQKFSDLCLNSDNTLNAYGQLELFDETVTTIYPDGLDPTTRNLASSYIWYNKPSHVFSAGNAYVTTDDTQATKVQNFQAYLQTLSSGASWYFFGDSLTAACYNTYGFKGFVDYLRYLIRDEFSRPNDVFINGGVYSGTYPGEATYASTGFVNYKSDVMSVLLGTNDLATAPYTTDSTGTQVSTYINTNIQNVYDEYQKANPNGWMLIYSIPTYYIDSATDTLNNSVQKANEALKTFAQDKDHVMYIDIASAIDYVVNNFLKCQNPTATSPTFADYYPVASMQEIYAADKLHFNTSGYIIITKQILSNLGFDYSKSKFLDF